MSKIIVTSREELAEILNQSIGDQLEGIKALIHDRINPPKSKLSIKEVAKELNVTELTVRNYIAKGYIKAEKIGRRVLIDSLSLEDSLNEVKSLKYRR